VQAGLLAAQPAAEAAAARSPLGRGILREEGSPPPPGAAATAGARRAAAAAPPLAAAAAAAGPQGVAEMLRAAEAAAPRAVGVTPCGDKGGMWGPVDHRFGHVGGRSCFQCVLAQAYNC
jgi:hypothetical protein